MLPGHRRTAIQAGMSDRKVARSSGLYVFESSHTFKCCVPAVLSKDSIVSRFSFHSFLSGNFTLEYGHSDNTDQNLDSRMWSYLRSCVSFQPSITSFWICKAKSRMKLSYFACCQHWLYISYWLLLCPNKAHRFHFKGVGHVTIYYFWGVNDV